MGFQTTIGNLTAVLRDPPVDRRAGQVYTNSTLPLWLGVLAAGVLLLHASNYLYFFVDDEAIPYVYAQNVLNGKGLSYNSFEGRVEGYSDFLHVGVATAILAVTRLLNVDKLSVFTIGRLVSMACGVGLVLVTFLALRKLPHMLLAGAVAGLAFLSSAGPLAVWSASSLEAVPFALLMTLLIYAMVSQARGKPLTWASAACASTALLMRVDGFVYVGAVLTGFLLFAVPAQRKEIWLRVVLPSALVFATYQAGRVLYFGELLSTPVYAKVLYKLRPHPELVTKAPEHNYARAFFATYGLLPLVALSTIWCVWIRARVMLACLVSAVLIVGYLVVVGDWMFGFRFFVPLLPLMVLLIASSVSALAARARQIGWFVVAGCVVWFGYVAYAFSNDYGRTEGHESWLMHPSFDPHQRFSRYYSLFEESRRYMRSGERIAYNQAGFLPFMLDLDNIDDLGICSKFHAELPTTDVFFTEVGRYEPLTSKPVFRAGEAYLLYREPRFVVTAEDLLRKANFNDIPREVLGGFYRLLFVDAARRNVVYVRTERSIHEFKTQPRRFLENLAHVSRLKQARINRELIPRQEYQGAFPWLRDAGRRFTVRAGYRVDLEFGETGDKAYEVHIDHLSSTHEMTVWVTLQSCTGRATYQKAIRLDPDRPRDFRDYLGEPIEACALSLDVMGPGVEEMRLELYDLRIQGQTPALAAYIARNLKFPAP